MSFITTCAEQDDLGGGRFRNVHYIKPVAYDDNGTLRAMVPTWLASGIVERPHIVTAARLMTSVSDEGLRRIHPTRETDRYVEIGTPYVKVGGVWRKVGFTGATRTANSITWHRGQADLRITHAGHFVKLDIELLGGYVPEDNFVAFPVGMSGLTRTGSIIYRDGVPVMQLRAPTIHDAANPEDVRAIAGTFVSLAGQPYYLMTLPSLTGMTRPVIDPTLALQPDATAGKDTIMLSDGPTYNYGTHSIVSIGERIDTASVRRALVAFDLSTVPASFTSATLSLYCTLDLSTEARTYRIYRQKRAWVEGTRASVVDNPPTGATWNRYDTTNNWATAGGFGADDCEQTAIGTRDFTASETLNEFKDFAFTPTTKDDLDLGNGWLIKADTETNDCYVFVSSDGATASERPKLVVEYTTGVATRQFMFYQRQRRTR